jgi:hypothetical protein
VPDPVRPRRRRAGSAVVLAAVATIAGCGSNGPDGPDGPIVDRIDDAVAAVEAYYDAPQDYLEVSATEEVVSVIVALADGGAEQAFWSPDDGLVEPVPIDVGERPTFRAGDIDVDPDRVFDHVREELPDSEIVDFAVTGAEDGLVVYDARLRSRQGGVLLVLLDREGRILGAQGE